MNEMTDMALCEIEGGNPLVLMGMAIGGYVGLLDKMENNPGNYTWMMDWYYN